LAEAEAGAATATSASAMLASSIIFLIMVIPS
jgi:hypothetical protein